ncbi:MAG TPA: hypothetical protein VHQ45_09350 [Gemmatimonadaceae bacterium]|nr:hypothetical protein [Gemmatimonadaceae bacterium]
MAMHWLYDIPEWLLAVLVVGAAVALSVGGFLATHALTRSLRAHTANDVAGAVLATVGLVHGILLALVAVAAWGNYAATRDAAEREAAALANMFRHTEGYPEPARGQLRDRLRAYLHLVITDEWPALRRDGASARTAQARDALAREWATFDPRAGREQVLHAATARELEAFLDARQARLAAGQAGLPGPLWAVALLGAVLTIGCTYFFRMTDGRAQLVMTSTVAASLGLVIYLILVLDHPMWGTQGLGPDAFVEVAGVVGGG